MTCGDAIATLSGKDMARVRHKFQKILQNERIEFLIVEKRSFENAAMRPKSYRSLHSALGSCPLMA